MSMYAGTAKTYFDKLARLLGALDREQIDSAIGVIAEAWQRGKQIITLGNGGSALTHCI